MVLIMVAIGDDMNMTLTSYSRMETLQLLPLTLGPGSCGMSRPALQSTFCNRFVP